MADTPSETNASRAPQRQTQEALQKQVAQLKREITKINTTLAERADEAARQSSTWLGEATDRASRATQALSSQARSVSETIRDNPGTVSSALLMGLLMGFAVGFALGQSTDNAHRRWY